MNHKDVFDAEVSNGAAYAGLHDAVRNIWKRVNIDNFEIQNAEFGTKQKCLKDSYTWATLEF